MKTASWRLRAAVLLDDIERSRGAPVPTVTELSHELGVARQTIWRDKDTLSRLSDLRGARSKQEGAAKRRSRDQRIRALELEVETLTRENECLLMNFLNACHKLRNQGIDPFGVFGAAATDVNQFKEKLLPST